MPDEGKGFFNKPSQEKRTGLTRDKSKDFYYYTLGALRQLVKGNKIEILEAVKQLKENKSASSLDPVKNKTYFETIDKAAQDLQREIEAEDYQTRL